MSEQEILAEIVRRLVAAIDPDKIILFGSRARGQSRPESDYDLLLVAPSSRPLGWRAGSAYAALWEVPGPKEIVWYTPKEFADRASVAGSLAQIVTREGRVLYERLPA